MHASNSPGAPAAAAAAAAAAVHVQPPLFPALLLPESFDAAHWVRLRRAGKRPAGKWAAVRPTETEIRAHVAHGGGAGLVPASVDLHAAGLTVFDVDHGDPDALAATYPPVALADTARGAHLWYRDTDAAGRGRGTFAAPGGVSGDVLSARAYAALHGAELVHLDNGIRSALSGAMARAGVGVLPLHLIQSGGRPRAPLTAARERADLAGAVSLFDAALTASRPISIGAHVGGRHRALARRLAKWANRKTWTAGSGGGAVQVDAEWIALRAACYWRAMPQRETFPLAEAVGILAWALTVRGRVWPEGHTPEWIARQAERGRRRGGRAERGDVKQSASMDASNEAARPWAAAGVSRATWYRRRRADRERRQAALFAVGAAVEARP